MPDPTFATANDVAKRLGRDLTNAEGEQVTLLLELADDLIVHACGKTPQWRGALDPVPRMLRLVALEAVVRVIKNPDGVERLSETLGARSRSASYSAESIGFRLTDREERLARNAVFGRSSGSAVAGSIVDDLTGEIPAS